MAKKSKPRRKRFIKILGVKVKIKYSSKELYDGDDLLHGAFDGNTMTIHVHKNEQEKATLLHECLHAAIYISGASNLISDKTEETIVSAIENGLKDYFSF